MVIFNSYVKLPEGNQTNGLGEHPCVILEGKHVLYEGKHGRTYAF